MGNLYLFLIIGLVAGLAQTVLSNPGPFSCWNCDSLTQPNCGENFDVNGIEPLNCEKLPFPMHLYHIIGTLNRNVTGCMKTTTTKETTESNEEQENGTKLLCYHCDSTTDDNCGEDFEDSAIYAIDCKSYQMPRHLIHVIEPNDRNATGCLKATTTSSALECYQCESLTNEACGDEKFSSTDLSKVDCSTQSMPSWLGDFARTVFGGNKKATGCSKTTMLLDGDRKQIARSCFWGDVNDVEKTCFDPSKLIDDKRRLKCDACTDDLCNGSETTKCGVAVFIIALIGRLLF